MANLGSSFNQFPFSGARRATTTFGGTLRSQLSVVATLQRASALLFGAALATFAHADLVVPAGASIALNGGSSDLACTDLIVAGNLSVDSGSIAGIRNVNIQAGGTIAVTSGTLSLSGDWANSGSFTAGTGLVSFADRAGCATSGGAIGGNNTFANLSFVTASGKTYTIASGSTQTVNQQLTIQGTSGAPLVLRGSVSGQPAYITLLGGQSTSNFGAADLYALGNWIAPNQTNAISGSGVTRVFGDPNAPPPTIPMLPHGALLLLALALAAAVRKTILKTEK
jgi:hypothetical protein